MIPHQLAVYGCLWGWSAPSGGPKKCILGPQLWHAPIKFWHAPAGALGRGWNRLCPMRLFSYMNSPVRTEKSETGSQEYPTNRIACISTYCYRGFNPICDWRSTIRVRRISRLRWHSRVCTSFTILPEVPSVHCVDSRACRFVSKQRKASCVS